MSLQKLQWGQALQRVLGCSGSNLAAQVHAEIIVTFEGTTEFGNPFMARQSYLPTEIHWGHKFVSIMGPPPPGQTRYPRRHLQARLSMPPPPFGCISDTL